MPKDCLRDVFSFFFFSNLCLVIDPTVVSAFDFEKTLYCNSMAVDVFVFVANGSKPETALALAIYDYSLNLNVVDLAEEPAVFKLREVADCPFAIWLLSRPPSEDDGPALPPSTLAGD